MDISIKKFNCPAAGCGDIKNHIIWKNIAKENIFMCELCWKKFDLIFRYRNITKITCIGHKLATDLNSL